MSPGVRVVAVGARAASYELAAAHHRHLDRIGGRYACGPNGDSTARMRVRESDHRGVAPVSRGGDFRTSQEQRRILTDASTHITALKGCGAGATISRATAHQYSFDRH